MSATIELEREGHRDGAGAEAGDGIDSATATTSLPAPPPVKPSKLNPALRRQHAAKKFVLKIKARFQLSVYKQFLEILHSYEDQQSTIPEVQAKISELFRDHNDLLEEFGQFLPEGRRTDAQNEHDASVQPSRRPSPRREEPPAPPPPPPRLPTTGRDKKQKAHRSRADEFLHVVRSKFGVREYAQRYLSRSVL
jgi:paired amphipathic helix protein Sin3a